MTGFTERIESHVNAILEAHPSCPRPIRFRILADGSYRATTSRIIVGFGICAGIAGVVLITTSLKSTDFFVGCVIAGFGLLLTLTPGIAAFRLYQAVKHGQVGEAEVIRVVYDPPGNLATLDSIQNGMARGKWRITVPGKILEEEFEMDKAWSSMLKPGKRVCVLLNRNTSHVVHALRPAS